jgi:hypothetical protein
MDELSKYLDLLYGGLEGYVYCPVKRPDSWEQKFFQWPSQADSLRDWIQVSDREDHSHVYISPAVYHEPKAQKQSIKGLQTVWVEFDGEEQIGFRDISRPTAIVQSSTSTHLHCYWQIPESSKEVVEDVNKRLTYYLGADTSGWDCTQLLRPPTTTNRKHDLPVVLSHFSGNSFGLNAFDSAPSVKAAPVEVASATDLPKPASVMSGRNLPTRLIQMVKLEEPPVGSRSSFLVRLAYELAEEGLSHLEITSLLYHADLRVKKFEGRSDQLLRLTQIAELAVHKIIVQDSIRVWSLEEILNAPPLEWIINPWLPKKGLMILSSAPNVGKTQLGMQLTSQLNLGENFLGLSAPNLGPLSIFFMSLEMDASGLAYIVNHQKKEYNSFPPNYHIITEESTLTHYENLIDEYKPVVVLIDSLTELIDLVEGDNDISKAKYALRWLKKIRRRYDTAIILIHHNRKATEGNKKPKGLADLEGTINLGRACDSAVQMWEDGSKGIELSGVKVRYGIKDSFYVKRNENLWFEREPSPGDLRNGESVQGTSGQRVDGPDSKDVRSVQVDASNGPESVQSDTFGITGFQSDFG